MDEESKVAQLAAAEQTESPFDAGDACETLKDQYIQQKKEIFELRKMSLKKYNKEIPLD